eukprot:SAG31_NODE_1445_length_8320_cov_3.454081_14_plen_178_part_00
MAESCLCSLLWGRRTQPHAFNIDETVSTLRFAQRAKTIKTTVKQNIVVSRKELEAIIERQKRCELLFDWQRAAMHRSIWLSVGFYGPSDHWRCLVEIAIPNREIAILKKGGTVAELTDEQEHELLEKSEEVVRLTALIEEMKQRESESTNQLAVVRPSLLSSVHCAYASLLCGCYAC